MAGDRGGAVIDAVQPQGERAMDFLRVEMPALEPGRYTITLRITDLVGGASATRQRTFQVVADAAPDG